MPVGALPSARGEQSVYAVPPPPGGPTTDAGIEFVKNEAGPMLDRIDGCRGLSMLVDRETGQCIATAQWESESAMQAADEQLPDPRTRPDILGAPCRSTSGRSSPCTAPITAVWPLSWLQGGDLDAMTERSGSDPSPARPDPGFCSASLLVNRSTGLGCATTSGSPAPRWKQPLLSRLHASRAASDSGGEIVACTSSTSPTRTCTSHEWPEQLPRRPVVTATHPTA